MTVATLAGYLISSEGVVTAITVEDPAPATYNVPKPRWFSTRAPEKHSLAAAMERVGKHVTAPTDNVIYHKVRGIKSLVYVPDERQAWSLMEPERG